MRIREGDTVGYREVLDQPEFDLISRVLVVYPDGIPSCPEPLVKIEGKAGVVLERHCTTLEKKPAVGRLDK